jgi:colanic acid biosynthesis glycosyl transferase WcaI
MGLRLNEGTYGRRSRIRILFVNQFFPPDTSGTSYMLGQLAEDLARVHEVTIVAGRPSYTVDASEFVPNGPVVRRVRSTSFHRRSLLGRACNYLSFLLLAPIEAVRTGRPDVVVAMTDPPLIGLVGAGLATRYRVPFVYINHDVYPDIAIAMGQLHNPLVVSAWRVMNRVMRARADRIVAISRDMAERLRSEGVDPAKLVYLPTWADSQPLDPAAGEAVRAEYGWSGRFVVMHAGNVGLAQNVGILADLAARVSEHPEIEVVVLGDGAAKPALEEMVAARGLRNLTLLPAVPKRRAQALMAAADLHVVSLVPGLWGCAMPSKTYGIMAAARPFVAAVDPGSEPARIVEEVGCGRWVRAGDGDALAAAVLELRGEPLDAMGERGRLAFEQRFSRALCTARSAEVIEAAISRREVRGAPGHRPR